ncbi:hypothetical protein BH10CYA1_BH10CYA1_14230 [soil metagenome]
MTIRPWRCLDTCTDNPVSKRCHYMTERYLRGSFYIKPNIKLFSLTTRTKYGVAMKGNLVGLILADQAQLTTEWLRRRF